MKPTIIADETTWLRSKSAELSVMVESATTSRDYWEPTVIINESTGLRSILITTI